MRDHQSLPIRRALISCSDKRGLDPLARSLIEQGVEIVSTGGTAKFLEQALKQPILRVEAITAFPEMLDGRVKTLHPAVFGGILARRDRSEHMQQVRDHKIALFDLVIVNLYPFREYLDHPLPDQIEHIDIGGPSLLRAAAKNFESVVVLSDPEDYETFVSTWKQHDHSIPLDFRKQMAVRTFSRTSAYDAAIAASWAPEAFPTSLELTPRLPLRYGENPHQQAIWAGSSAPQWKTLQGKELSYNNLLDSEAARRIVADFSEPAVAIIKHTTPCGVAYGERPLSTLFEAALSSDRLSAFGGIVATNRPVDDAFAEQASQIFLEVILAPSFSPEALARFAGKKNLRLLEWNPTSRGRFEIRSALGGWLVQQPDRSIELPELKTVTRTAFAPDRIRDIRLAWTTVCHVRSNAIVIARDGTVVGVGGGQVSRVDAVEMALKKAVGKTAGAVLASDAFFPFRDNIDLLKNENIAVVVQPGGSVRDTEVIAACDELGIAMAFTGQRGFRH